MNTKIFDIFSKLLEIHISTKTTDSPFHKDSRKAYELAFDCDHLVREMNQDIEVDEPKEMEEVAVEAYDLVESIKTELSAMIKDNKDTGMDNLLRTLYERANSVCGTMRGYAKKCEHEEEEEAEEEDEEEVRKPMESKGLKMKY